MDILQKLHYWKDNDVKIRYDHKKTYSKVTITCSDPTYNDTFKVDTRTELDGDDIEKIACNGWDGLRDVVHFYVSWEIRQLEEHIGFCLPTKISADILCELKQRGNIYNQTKKELFELWGWEEEEEE